MDFRLKLVFIILFVLEYQIRDFQYDSIHPAYRWHREALLVRMSSLSNLSTEFTYFVAAAGTASALVVLLLKRQPSAVFTNESA